MRTTRETVGLMVAFGLTLSACGLSDTLQGQKHHRMYTGAVKSAGEIATLQPDSDNDTRLLTIDGKSGPNLEGFGYSSPWDNSFVVDLLPGQHMMDFTYFAGSKRIESPMSCTFDFTAGKSYILESDITDHGVVDVELTSAVHAAEWVITITDQDGNSQQCP